MNYDRDFARAAHGADHPADRRWRCHGPRDRRRAWWARYGSGGGYGAGYDGAPDRPPERRERRRGRGPGVRRGAPRAWRRPGRRWYEEAPYPRRARHRHPGTAAREYGRAYPYFASAGAAEAAVGYPPGDTLSPDAYVRGLPPRATLEGEID